nr:ATP-dependent helicase [Stutzerimonas stutzeri]
MRLEQNYRSTQAIVESAGDLIKHNQDRLAKSPFSKGEMGEKPCLLLSNDHRTMADEIASSIAQALADGKPASEFAVLYRTNRMAMLLEQGLRRYKVPYHVVGGMSLFDRSEVVAVTSALRLASNPNDVYALKSLQPYIDGFGEASCYALCDWLNDELGASLNELPEQIPNLPQRGLAAFRSFYEDLRTEIVICENAPEFVSWVIEGPMAVLEREKDDQIRDRKAQHLEALGKDIDLELGERLTLEPELTWRGLMLEVALRDARQSEATKDQVTLSTVHRSKGLEWDWVYIAGFSEGLMPLDSRTELEDGDAACGHMEEERRLAYVGLTRARQACYLHHSDSYGFPGSREDRVYEPSRFIEEMGLVLYRPSVVDQLNEADSFDFEEFKSDFLGLARGMN